MIRSRGANGSTAELVISQLLQGWGESTELIDIERLLMIP